MQREQTDAFNRDLKEAISDVKKREYRRELLSAVDSATLRIIDHRIRTDSQLTVNDRLQLLSEIERFEVPAGQEELPGRERSHL